MPAPSYRDPPPRLTR